MNARGTRRPHVRRVRSKPMRRVSKSSSGCLVMVAALASSTILAGILAIGLGLDQAVGWR